MKFISFRKTFISAIVIFFVMSVSFVSNANAYTMEPLPDNSVQSDFVVGPGKIELFMDPGETKTVELTVSNRMGEEKTFLLSEEDFVGSSNPEQTVVLLGDDAGPYSLKSVINYGSSTIDIPHATKVRIPVTITLPADAQPGGLYGSVLVSTATKKDRPDNTSAAEASSPIITRIGTLFFVRVNGEVKEQGRMTDFYVLGRKSLIAQTNPLLFGINFENTGSVHLAPRGTVKITNMLGSTVGNIEVEPWFAMPNSLRYREVAWKTPFMFGRYTAEASILPGYGEIPDVMTVSFWVIPWKILAIVLVGLFVIIMGLRFIFSRFSIVKR